MDTFIITCEHGGNRIPAPYRRLFREQSALLDSHRGYDPGSLVMAKALARACRAPLFFVAVVRLCGLAERQDVDATIIWLHALAT